MDLRSADLEPHLLGEIPGAWPHPGTQLFTLPVGEIGKGASWDSMPSSARSTIGMERGTSVS